ncbi:MAG: 3-phosphoshikimate 1-carboxyvinyltransferase [Gammaproteobacteria bacterium]|nr:3-phosphoshikimate 1-carboxyvinyltransferase [Gammaproteobacteria bacterium]
MNWICSPGAVQGEARMPGDKSVSHRAAMLASIAKGQSEIKGFLPGSDCLATLAAMESLGVSVRRLAPDRFLIDGSGADGLEASRTALDLGNSGTGMRLLAGLLAGASFDSVLVGDESLSSRPMGRIVKPLREMGASISSDDGHAPLTIKGRSLHGIHYKCPVASAQVKSAILLAGLNARGATRVEEPAVTRDHTERMLRWMGCDLQKGKNFVGLKGGQRLRGRQIDVPGDFSAAAFFIVAAAIAPEGAVSLPGVGVNPTRIGLIDLLSMMGADINIGEIQIRAGEPVADIEVAGGKLRGIDVPPDLVSLAIDEFPVFFIAAACASGTTRLSGATELRVKESDRIEVMATGLKRLGIKATTRPDGIIIEGGTLQGGSIDSCGDHRIAMAFAVASAAATADIHVRDVANVATSFPNFVDVARRVGLNIANEPEDKDTSYRD